MFYRQSMVTGGYRDCLLDGFVPARAAAEVGDVVPHVQASGFQVSGETFYEGQVHAGVGDEEVGHGGKDEG